MIDLWSQNYSAFIVLKKHQLIPHDGPSLIPVWLQLSMVSSKLHGCFQWCRTRLPRSTERQCATRSWARVILIEYRYGGSGCICIFLTDWSRLVLCQSCQLLLPLQASDQDWGEIGQATILAAYLSSATSQSRSDPALFELASTPSFVVLQRIVHCSWRCQSALTAGILEAGMKI